MSNQSFKHIRSASIKTLNIEINDYRHQATGARHIHIATEDDNNTFLVAFLTVPQDSKGVAHILEHTALCGSEKYPVRDPFFMMTRRSLNNFMNAFTSSDWTAYPFATKNRKDFKNLLNVYLDAAFFPTLDELDFAQEGHRLEFNDPDNPESPLEYKGVVFNEMKGAMSSPVSQLYQCFTKNLYPTTTYHHNSGGEPEDIPKLSYSELIDFHRKHYHPSNAIFMTYGNIPASEHQQVFEENVLSRFERLEIDFAVPDEQRFAQPKVVESTYTADENETTEKRTHVVLGWLLGPITDTQAILEAQLASRILLSNSASPLLHLLETSDLGTSPSPLCGLDDSSREISFSCGLEGGDPEQAADIEALILKELNRIAQEGVDLNLQQAALHQFELSRREIGGDRFPYGLYLLLDVLGPTIHGGDPVDSLAIDDILETLHKKVQTQDFIQHWVQQNLLNNPHRLRLTLKPDPSLAKQKNTAEKQNLSALQANMSSEEKSHIVKQAQRLQSRQAQEDDPNILPKVGLEDVAEDLFIPTPETHSAGHLQTSWYPTPTNGLAYHSLIIDLPQMEAELQQHLPLFASCLTEVGCAGEDYMKTQARQAAITGGISASCSLRSSLQDKQQYRGYFVLSSKALTRNFAAMAQLLQDTLLRAQFNELPRLKEIISQIRLSEEHSITGSGHSLALIAASAGLSPVATQNNEWHGPLSIDSLKKLDDALKNPAALEALAQQFDSLRDILLKAPKQLLVIGEGKDNVLFHDTLSSVWQSAGHSSPSTCLSLPLDSTPVREAWITNTQVNFCARVLPAVPAGHPDAPAFSVLASFLRNGFLHTAIREKGGAYGGGANYSSDAAAFRFYSYRDPRLKETLNDFERSVDWLINHHHSRSELEQAILNVMSGIDKPSSPAGTAKQAFYANLHGRTPEQRQKLRAQTLQVTLDDLKRVGEDYLVTPQQNIAIIGSQEHLAPLEAEGFIVRKL